MPRVRIQGSAGFGVEIDHRTYGAGEIVEVSPALAARLVSDRRAVLVEEPEVVETATPAVETRDPLVRRRRR